MAEAATAPSLSVAEERLLKGYVDRFNARDFDAIREMISEEVRFEMVHRKTARGREEVSTYFGNYAASSGWEASRGLVDGTPAMLIFGPRGRGAGVTHFVLLDWKDDLVVTLRDFRYAPYEIPDAEIAFWESTPRRRTTKRRSR